MLRAMFRCCMLLFILGSGTQAQNCSVQSEKAQRDIIAGLQWQAYWKEDKSLITIKPGTQVEYLAVQVGDEWVVFLAALSVRLHFGVAEHQELGSLRLLQRLGDSTNDLALSHYMLNIGSCLPAVQIDEKTSAPGTYVVPNQRINDCSISTPVAPPLNQCRLTLVLPDFRQGPPFINRRVTPDHFADFKRILLKFLREYVRVDSAIVTIPLFSEEDPEVYADVRALSNADSGVAVFVRDRAGSWAGQQFIYDSAKNKIGGLKAKIRTLEMERFRYPISSP